MRRSFYDPTAEQLSRLSGPWSCAYSGGKDSTSLVTWIEWLRRADWLTVQTPRLVLSDTTVEDPSLAAIARDMMACLSRFGWQCTVVQPAIHEKLYNRILGIGLTSIHPGIKGLRWCTRATKIDPMERWRVVNQGGLTLTGLRLGESRIRDGKIKKKGCSAGSECGIPDPSERTYSPLLEWTTCQVIDWLNGPSRLRPLMDDVFAITRELVGIYGMRLGQPSFAEFGEPEIRVARFGCIGCPAISAERAAPRSVIARSGAHSPLNELYDVWFEARQNENRLYRAGKTQRGPIRMEVRKRLFDRVMDIQRRAGVVLITPENEAFIRKCWEDKVYPRGWAAADEEVQPPSDTPLFQELS